MAVSDEDQVRAMLESMGVGATDEAFPQPPEPQPTPSAAPSSVPEQPAVAADFQAVTRSDTPSALDSVTALLEKRGGAGSHGREMSLSTLVHLLGLSTATQVNLLDSKLDVLNSKLSTVVSKLERLSSDVTLIKSEAAIDRVDFALNEMKALLKRLAPIAAGAADGESKAEARPSARAKVLTSEPPKKAVAAETASAEAAPEPAPAKKPETKIIEKDHLEEFQGGDDASFQAAEAKRVRDQQSK